MTGETNKNRSTIIWLGTYIFVLIVTFIFYRWIPENDLLWANFYADVFATGLIFLAGIIFKNASMYDAYWSLAPFPILIAWWASMGWEMDPRKILVFTLVTIWGLRLTYNWYRGWAGLHHEDWRYVDLKNKSGVFYPLVNFFGIHLYPTVLVFLGLVPLYKVFTSIGPALGVWDLLGTLIVLMGIYFEWVGDNQLREYKLSNPEKGQFLKTGLWARTRHPNYFGELSFWVGLAFFSLSLGPFYWLNWVGALVMAILFFLISGPMMDKRMKEKRPGYAEHCKNVPMIIPKLRITK